MSEHVLLARLDNAGDVLLTGPAARAVRASAGRVTYLCGSAGADAARMLPGVDDVITFAAGWVVPGAGPVRREAILALVEDLAGRGIEQAVIFTSFHQSPLPLALVLRMAGIQTIAAISDDFAGSLLDVRHRLDDGHEVERNLSLVATLGYRLPPSDDGKLRVREPALSAQPPGPPDERRFVVVHPGSSVPARTLAPGQWTDAARALADAGFFIVVTGGPNETDLTAEVAAGVEAEKVLDLGGQLSFAALAALLGRADAVLCGNTGPAHLAAAVNTPVVVAFPPTVPAARWRPWGVPHVLLGDQDIACAGCRASVCPLPVQRCLTLEPQTVVDAVMRVLTNKDHCLPALVATSASPSQAAPSVVPLHKGPLHKGALHKGRSPRVPPAASSPELRASIGGNSGQQKHR